MADDLNRLLIKIQADTSQLSSALQAAQTGVASASNNIESRLAKNSQKFASWSDGINQQLTQLLTVYGLWEVAQKGLDAVDTVGNLKSQAAAAGLTTDQFQELAFAVKEAGGATDDFSKGLNKFSINMAQVRLNTGEFNTFLNEQAPALQKSLAATTSQAEAVKVLSDFMAGLGDESQRSTVLQQAFGKSSSDLVDVMSKGSAAFADAADKAHELGAVLGNDVVNSADETAKKFADLETAGVSAFQNIAVSIAGEFTKQIAQTKTNLDQVKTWWTDLVAFIEGNQPSVGGTSASLESSGHSGLLSGLSEQAAKLPPIVPKQTLRPKPDQTGANALAGLTQQFDTSNGNIQQALQDQYDQELKLWQDMLNKKQISEQQFAEARVQLGVVMLNEQKANLGAQTQLEKDFYTQTTQLIDSTFMDSFSTALSTGKFKASDFFNSILQGFAKIATEVLVLKPLINSLFAGSTGANGLGGILNGLIGGVAGAVGAGAGGWTTTVTPARAAGGPGVAGQSYLTGEHGPEIFTPSSNGSFGGSGIYARGNATGGNTYNIDARGADTGVADRLAKLFSKPQPSPVATVRQASKRFPNRS